MGNQFSQSEHDLAFLQSPDSINTRMRYIWKGQHPFQHLDNSTLKEIRIYSATNPIDREESCLLKLILSDTIILEYDPLVFSNSQDISSMNIFELPYQEHGYLFEFIIQDISTLQKPISLSFSAFSNSSPPSPLIMYNIDPKQLDDNTWVCSFQLPTSLLTSNTSVHMNHISLKANESSIAEISFKISHCRSKPHSPISDGYPSPNPLKSFHQSLSMISLDDVMMKDGPLLRANLHQMEAKTTLLKKRLKHIIKLLEGVLEAEKHVLRSRARFVQSLEEVPGFYSLQPIIEAMEQGIISSYHENFLQQITNLVLDPLINIYEQDIKSADHQKREFEQASDQYYTFLNKYLSLKNLQDKRRNMTDEKYKSMKQAFDLGRFDYVSFMQDLHIRKEQEIMHHLFDFFIKQAEYYQKSSESIEQHIKPQLNNLLEQMHHKTKSLSVAIKQREEMRREITSPKSFDEYDDSASEDERIEYDDSTFILDSVYDTRTKEGFLNVRKAEGSHHWKRYWCVVSNGCIHEYSKWENKLKPKNVLPLKICMVRIARDQDRRFCFELLSPQFHRIYQASNEEEVKDWIQVIQSSIQAVIQGLESKELHLLGERDENFSESSSCSLSKEKPNQISTDLSGNEKITLHSSSISPTDGSSRSSHKRFQSVPAPLKTVSEKMSSGKLLLEELYRLDLENRICADCQASMPEWCIINIGCLVCIECCGIHRSLGSHVSKARSILMDVACFTQEIKEFIKTNGNYNVNQRLEYRLSNPDDGLKNWRKPIPSDERRVKQRFIEAKYVQTLFIK